MILYRLVLGIGLVVLAGSQTAGHGRAPEAEPVTRFLPLVVVDQPVVRLSELYVDGLAANDADEAFRLHNVSRHEAQLAGYTMDDGRRTVRFPPLTLPAGEDLWCARDAAAFQQAFGFAPGCEYGADASPAVPNLTGTALRFANDGGRVTLRNPAATAVDVLVYAAGDPSPPGWSGPAVQAYTPSSSFPGEGQVLFRKMRWHSAGPQPFVDSDTAADWSQDLADPVSGRRVQYPGWDLERFGEPPVLLVTGTITVALAPDNLASMVRQALAAAQESILVESYTFEHLALAELLAAQAQREVAVTVLLEGDPVGGISDTERYAARLIEEAGGEVWFMVRNRNAATHDRYAYLHAKFAVVDRRLLLISTENFTQESMPEDDQANGTAGQRGAALLTDAPPIVAEALALAAADLDPTHHADLWRWAADDPKYGPPPAGFVPAAPVDGALYQPVHPKPLVARGPVVVQLLPAPEAGLLPAPRGGVLGLVAAAGPGDTVLVEQLFERQHWGAVADTAESAPNPRLEAYVEAARRGATVRVLLDAYFDHGENRATVTYLNRLARAEDLDLQARLGNPTGGGLHNKMILVQAGAEGWAHVGSLNGSEASTKLNRELALQVQSNAVFDYLAEAFWHDWKNPEVEPGVRTVRSERFSALPAH
jgi:phosphatidylserine/phosphatidylglycerophosphate/cardiolipin synthase-like enzyme